MARKKLNRHSSRNIGVVSIINTTFSKMTSTIQSIDLNALFQDDPVSKFLIDGGSWADAIEMDLELEIPILEARLRAACKKQNPSAERFRAKLLTELRAAYSYTGKGTEAADAFLAEALTSSRAEKAKPKPLPLPTNTTNTKKPTSKNAWDLLANDSDDE